MNKQFSKYHLYFYYNRVQKLEIAYILNIFFLNDYFILIFRRC